jgi:hypothetical protein
MVGFDRLAKFFSMNVSYIDSSTHDGNTADSGEDVDGAADAEADRYVYDSPAGSGDSLGPYRAVLISLGIEVPDSLFREAQNDADTAVGNRAARHHADGRFEELLGASSETEPVTSTMIASTEHEPAEPIAVGCSEHKPSGFAVFETYVSDEIGIELLNSTFARMGAATMTLMYDGSPHPGPFGVWLKDWNENEGVPQALVAAGLVRLTGATFQTTLFTACHAELTKVGREMYIRSKLDLWNREVLSRVIAEMVCSQSLTEAQADYIQPRLPGSTCTKLLREGLTLQTIIKQLLKSH